MNNVELERLKQVLDMKIEKGKKNINEKYNPAMNNYFQIQIEVLEWVLEEYVQKHKHIELEVLESIIENKITRLKTQMDKTTYIVDTDALYRKIETLRWIIFAINHFVKDSKRSLDMMI
jgi:hypothetical protein